MQLVHVGENTWLLVEQIEGVAIDFPYRRGGQSNQQEVEVSEYASVLVADGLIRFINNDTVEVTYVEARSQLSARTDSSTPSCSEGLEG